MTKSVYGIEPYHFGEISLIFPYNSSRQIAKTAYYCPKYSVPIGNRMTRCSQTSREKQQLWTLWRTYLFKRNSMGPQIYIHIYTYVKIYCTYTLVIAQKYVVLYSFPLVCIICITFSMHWRSSGGWGVFPWKDL